MIPFESHAIEYIDGVMIAVWSLSAAVGFRDQFFLSSTKTINMKTLHCRDAGFDCGQVIQASTTEEVMKQAAAHAQSVHHTSITPQMEASIRQLIRNDAPAETENKG